MARFQPDAAIAGVQPRCATGKGSSISITKSAVYARVDLLFSYSPVVSDIGSFVERQWPGKRVVSVYEDVRREAKVRRVSRSLPDHHVGHSHQLSPEGPVPPAVAWLRHRAAVVLAVVVVPLAI